MRVKPETYAQDLRGWHIRVRHGLHSENVIAQIRTKKKGFVVFADINIVSPDELEVRASYRGWNPIKWVLGPLHGTRIVVIG